MIVLSCGIALACGLLAGLAGFFTDVSVLLLAVPMALGAGLASLLRLPRFSRLLLLLAVAIVGVQRGGQARLALSRASGLNETGSHALLCRVSGDPEEKGLALRFPCILTGVDGSPAKEQSGLLVSAPLTPMPRYGDVIGFSGEPTTPASQPAFNYGEYLAHKGISSVVTARELQIVQPGGWSLRRWLYDVRRGIKIGVQRTVPQPEAAFITGVVAGVDEGMPGAVREDLKRAGILHMLVVSGFNVSLLASGLIGALGRITGPGLRFAGLVALCVIYTLLTGAEPPVIRAAGMAVLAAAATLSGRRNSGLVSLVLASATMALISPYLLLDPSYQLSVTTTAGMLWASNWRLPRGQRWEFAAPVLGAVSTTAAAQALSLPLMSGLFGQVALSGLLTNGLVAPVQGPLMFFAILASLAGQLPMVLAQALSLPAWLLARYTLLVAHLMARVPWAVIPAGTWPPVVTSAYYVFLLGVVDASTGRFVWRTLRRSVLGLTAALRRRFALTGLAAVTVLLWAVALQLPDGRLHVAFLNVGQGDAILITTPAGHRILVDGGPDPAVLSGHVGRALPMWQRELDVILLTHGDMDHMGGLLGLPTRYSVRYLVQPAGPIPQPWLGEWRALEERAHAAPTAAAGMRIVADDGAALEILFPPADGCPFLGQSDNDCSAVARLEYGSFSALLTGDAQDRVEHYLADEGALSPVEVLKVAHHGSAYATGDDLLARVAPRLAVISVGRNRYRHPSQSVLQRLAATGVSVLRTDQVGTVEVVTDGALYTVETGL